MAHPPHRTSDLTFADFCRRICKHNHDVEPYRRVGVKFDFKDARCVVPCLELLRDLAGSDETVGWPVFLNADVWMGPGGNPPKIQPSDFFAACFDIYPAGTLSPGWTCWLKFDGKGCRPPLARHACCGAHARSLRAEARAEAVGLGVGAAAEQPAAPSPMRPAAQRRVCFGARKHTRGESTRVAQAARCKHARVAYASWLRHELPSCARRLLWVCCVLGGVTMWRALARVLIRAVRCRLAPA